MGEGRCTIVCVSSSTRKENKKGRSRENAKEAAFPMNSMATFGIVKVIECSDSGRMESEGHHVGEWRGLLLIINYEEAVQQEGE